MMAGMVLELTESGEMPNMNQIIGIRIMSQCQYVYMNNNGYKQKTGMGISKKKVEFNKLLVMDKVEQSMA